MLMAVSASALAQTTPTFGEKAIGAACGTLSAGFDFDTLFQCNTSNASGGLQQKAPLFVGTVTAPPYANTTCDANKAGMIQWTGSEMQYCNGTSWMNFGAGVCAGPASVSFTAQTGVAVSTAITSNAETMSGFSCTAQVVCNGCIIIKNSVAVGTSATTVAGDTIAVQQTSAATYDTMATVTAYVGSTAGSFSVTTGLDDCDGTPTIGTVCSDGTVYAGLTPDGNVKMFTTPCDFGQIWNGSACTGTRLTQKWSLGASLNTGVTNGSAGSANTAGLYALNANADGPYQAATACHDLIQNGHEDWYLPSLGELNILYTNRVAIGNFDLSGPSYWPSTEYGGISSAYRQLFDTGAQSSSTKGTSHLLRCTRK